MASIAIVGATWVLSFAVLGSPSLEKPTGESGVSAVLPADAALVNSAAATQPTSMMAGCSLVMTGLAVAALVLPFGLSSISLLRRTTTLESRVTHLARRTSAQLEEQAEPDTQSLLLQGHTNL